MTVIERASRALCQHDEEGCWETHVGDVRRAIRAVRTPDMNMTLRLSRELGVPASVIDLCWTRTIDAILKESHERT